MRILHINCNYIGTTLHQLMVENLDRLEIENRVFVPVYSRSIGVIEPNQNVCVSECFKKWDRLFFDYKQSKILKSVEKNEQVGSFDIIHAYTLFTDGNCARKLSKKYNVPFVVAVRNTDVNSFFRLMPHLRGRGVKTMREAKAVFFLSEAYRKQVFEKYIPLKYRDEIAKKTYIIPNGIDDFWFENSDAEKNRDFSYKKIKLIYAGRIDKNKNIPTIQKAVGILRDKGFDATLTVVGKVADRQEFERISENEFTTYIPAKPKEELINLYRENDIFVMPSFTESFGLVYVEAMSQGLPVIYSKGQGFDGQFPEGEVGFSADSHSAEDVADAVVKITESYGALSSQAVNGAKRFNWDEITARYDEIYKAVGEI